MSKATTQEAKQQEPAKAEVLPLNHQAKPERFSVAEQLRKIYTYILPGGTNFEDVLTPEFWLPVLRELKPWSRIEVVEEEGKFWAELLVRRVDHRGATVHVLCVHELGGVGAVGRLPANVDGAHIRFAGAHRQWAVERDGNNLRDGFPTEAAARLWLESHSKVTQPKGVA